MCRSGLCWRDYGGGAGALPGGSHEKTRCRRLHARAPRPGPTNEPCNGAERLFTASPPCISSSAHERNVGPSGRWQHCSSVLWAVGGAHLESLLARKVGLKCGRMKIPSLRQPRGATALVDGAPPGSPRTARKQDDYLVGSIAPWLAPKIQIVPSVGKSFTLRVTCRSRSTRYLHNPTETQSPSIMSLSGE